MRKSKLEALRDAKVVSSKPVELDGLDGLHDLLLGGKGINPTQRLIRDSDASAIAYMGMVGAAKTSTICSVAWLWLLLEPGYKLLVGRNDYNDLKDTTGRRMEEMLLRLPKGTLLDRDKSPPMKWFIKPLGDTDQISEITFMGLHERPSSYEFHGAILDEADEVPEDSYGEVHSRCRLPGKTNKVLLAFNPPDEDHYLYTECTGLNAKGEKVKDPTLKVYVPMPGENVRNLRDGYYEDLRKRLPPDMVKRLVEGMWGSSIAGKPVYGNEFNRKVHVRDVIHLNESAPLVVALDFGYRHPFAIWMQPTMEGGLNVLREEMGENMDIHEWAPKVVSITNTHYHQHAGELIYWGDPAAKQQKDTGSTLAALLKYGIMLHYTEGARIDPGIRAVRMLLSRMSGGKPAFNIDKKCSVTIRMLEKGYHYPDPQKESGDPNKPKKDGFYDHSADTLRYGVVGIFGAINDVARDFSNYNSTTDVSASYDLSYRPELDRR